MASFESVVDEYDAARPAYPAGVYDALGDLAGLVVLDVGAGTGIATRQLLARSATVVAVDRGSAVLGRAVARTPGLPAVVADGAVLPVRAGAVDLICCAQAWHWLDEATRAGEAHRALGDGGRWAGWWSHARADGEAWFEAYWSTIERACPGIRRTRRDVDWGATVGDSGLFEMQERVVVSWTRQISVDEWMTDEASHSYVTALRQPERRALLDRLRRIVEGQFPTGAMSVRHETWLWIGTKT